MKGFTVISNGIQFMKRSNKRRATGMVKSVYFTDSGHIPANMFCASDDIEVIYDRLISWCKIHGFNINKIQSVIWN